MMLTTPLHLAPRLGMSGAVPVLPLYAFTAWTQINVFAFIILQNSATVQTS